VPLLPAAPVADAVVLLYHVDRHRLRHRPCHRLDEHVAARGRLDWPNPNRPSATPRLWQWQDDANNRIEVYHDGSQWKLRRIKVGLIEEATAVHAVANGDVATTASSAENRL